MIENDEEMDIILKNKSEVQRLQNFLSLAQSNTT